MQKTFIDIDELIIELRKICTDSVTVNRIIKTNKKGILLTDGMINKILIWNSKPTLPKKKAKHNKDFTAPPKVCPRNHSITRQLSEDGYCRDCGGYPLREGKPS